MQTVLVFGAGIAGLSAAHYLAQRNFKVTVVESLPLPGGLARSERRPEDGNIPSEYSWRGFGGWYHNTFDIMKEIRSAPLPLETEKEKLENVYERELSRPITFLLVPDAPTPMKDMDTFLSSLRLSTLDKAKLAWLAAQEWTASDERSERNYAHVLMRDWLNDNLTPQGAKTLGSVLGPWVGVDASRASIFHVSRFFRKNTFPGPPSPYYHPPIVENSESKQAGRPAFTQGNASPWLILRRPSNEAWFDPWVKQLQEMGVTFLFNTRLEELLYVPHRIAGAKVTGNKVLVADYYVMAIDPFHAREIVARSPGLREADASMRMFEPLVAGGPHRQVSFQVAFDEQVKLPGVETAVILVDSEYNITFYSQDQLFHPQVDLGAPSVWSGTATINTAPGSLYGLPFSKLTKAQFQAEILHQMRRSQALNDLVKSANGGRSLSSFPIKRFQVWHTWQFPKNDGSDTLSDPYPKWVNDTRNIRYQPDQRTSLDNLLVAGAHTKTETDLYSMEAAVESGRKAADAISRQDTVLHQNTPFQPLRAIDKPLYRVDAPSALVLLLLLAVGIVALLFLW